MDANLRLVPILVAPHQAQHAAPLRRTTISPVAMSNSGKRFLLMLASAVDNHRRLRAREDGEKPSPPRDCKEENFRRVPLSFEPDRCDSAWGWEGRADAQK
jgi:hypothetical protein